MAIMKRNKLISRPWLILICAIVLTALLSLPRINMMLRLEESGIMNFDHRDYFRKLFITFLYASLILIFNLYTKKIKLGLFDISFSRASHLLSTNLLLFVAIHSFFFFRFASRAVFETGQSQGSFYLWNMVMNASLALVCILIAISYRHIKENYLVKLENEALQKETAQARFVQLREQVNPHFMFNSFSTLNGLIEESPERAQKFLMNMSDVFRYVLKIENDTTVSLEEEFHFAKVYVDMIKERFGDAVQFQFEIPTENLSHRVVPLSLQMLIENAIKHNNSDSLNPLLVSIKVVGDYMEVHNNLQKRTNVEKNHSIGLYNLNQRYKYASKQELIIVKTNEAFSVKIPLLK